jgi:hypothetical protein
LRHEVNDLHEQNGFHCQSFTSLRLLHVWTSFYEFNREDWTDRAEKVQAYWREITGNDKISVTHAMHDVAEDLQVKLGTEKAYFALIGVSCVDTKDGEINTGYTSGSGFRDRDPSDFTIGDVNAMTTREIRAIIDRHDEIGKERFKEVDWEFFLGSADVEDIKTAECHYQMTDCLCCS